MKLFTKNLTFGIENKDWQFILLFASFLIFMLAVTLFYTGLKNVDYSRNILYMSFKLNMSEMYDDFYDMGLQGDVYDFDEWYRIGFKQLYNASHLFMISFIILFFYILSKKW